MGLVAQLCPTLCNSMDSVLGFPRQEYWSGLPPTSSGIFAIQRLKPGLPHCRRILYRLNQQGNPKVGISMTKIDGGRNYFPGEGNGDPFQYSSLENPINTGAWQATVHVDGKELDTTDRLSSSSSRNHLAC